MNLIGKILVILNLIVALVIVGFMAVTFTTRDNWKKYTEGFKREMDIAGRNAGLAEKTAADLQNELKKLRGELDTEKRNARIAADLLEAKSKDLQSRLDEELIKAKEADLTAQKALGEVQRFKEEVKDLNNVIEARQKKIVEMEDNAKRLREFALAKEKESQDDRARNESLRAEVLRLNLNVADLEAGPKGKLAMSVPPAKLRGTIEKVESDLVQISLGSDQGLKKNQILQVQRLKPRAEYLGSIRLVEVDFHKSIGRWMTTSRPEGKRLQPGDQVVSSLER
jgi:chromosome segregation ATPase